MQRADVLIIGAGPAGARTAKLLAERGVDVLIVEKKEKVGVPLQCAEYVPWQLQRECNALNEFVCQRVERMVTHLEGKRVGEIVTKGFIIDRERFDAYLLKEAEEAGTKVLLGHAALCFEDGALILQNGGRLMADIIVCADGVKSVGRRYIAKKARWINALQYRLALKQSLNDTLIFFSEDIPGGYGWIFPKRDVANVGVGVDKEFGKSPKEVLDKFLEKVQDIVHKKVLKMHAGLVPVSGMDVLEEKGILFVGDAAAMAHPVTGAGVSNAFLAASILAEAVLEGRDVAKRYKRECLSFFGSIFGHALKRRELFLSVWREGKKFSSVLEKVWVGFRDYHE